MSDATSYSTPAEVLREVWGYPSFRPMQQEVIRSVMEGHDTLALMPTGGGKSITFQVPALLLPGLTIVITPLVALMRDQVEGLRRKGIKAQALHSGMTRAESVAVFDNIVFEDKGYKILYVAPERLRNEFFLRHVGDLDVSLLVVDECHCISQWGYDFRPDYLSIADFRGAIGSEVPVLALTATATPRVVEDVTARLDFRKGYRVFRKSFYRPSLTYVVRQAYDKPRELIHILSGVPGSSLVYVRTRRQAERYAELLQAAGFSADYFHAGLDSAAKEQRQKAWQSDRLRIMVCTTAFGMGIDKDDVRLVIHPIAPANPESYYQEAGRAGRDGKRSYAVLLYTPGEDEETLSKMIHAHYPPPEVVATIYNLLGDYFRVAVESGAGSFHELKPFDFEKIYHVPATLLRSALHILSLAGYLEYREDYRMASRLIFTVDRSVLYSFFSDDEQRYDDLVELILRSYEGVFTEYAFIDEGMLQAKLGLHPDTLYKMLLRMDRWGVIDYVPGKRTDYVVYSRQRQRPDQVKIPRAIYELQLEGELDRLRKMMDYIHSDDDCRVKVLMDYFGEKKPLPCGYCDYCLEHKDRLGLTYRRIDDIAALLLARPHGCTREELQEAFPDVRDREWSRILRHLSDEGYETTLEDDRLHLRIPS